MWSRKKLERTAQGRASIQPAQGLAVRVQPLKPQVGQNAPPPGSIFCIGAPQLSDYQHKRDTTKTERERAEITGLGLLRAALYEHTQKISKPTVSLCVCVIQSLFCILAEQDEGKSLLRRAAGCRYCFLVARLPGIDKGPRCCRARTFSHVFAGLFEGKQTHRCSCAITFVDTGSWHKLHVT